MFDDMAANSGSGGSDGRTRTFSLRLTEAEHTKIREIATRMETSEASVIRYAIRSMLNRVAPLYDPGASGYSLIPVFVECGAELTSYFNLDVSRLEKIINRDVRKTNRKVDSDDLVLLSMSGLGEPQVHAKLRELKDDGVELGDVPQTLRSYFYEKYIYQTNLEETGD